MYTLTGFVFLGILYVKIDVHIEKTLKMIENPEKYLRKVEISMGWSRFPPVQVISLTLLAKCECTRVHSRVFTRTFG